MVHLQFEAQRQTIIYHWLNGTRLAIEIHQKMSISICTIRYNLKKLEETAWAQAHINDNWDMTIFTDETAFDFFQNKVKRWQKNGKRPI
ncbi:hypothetical protein RCL_jg4891.t1 [Rhizophagus clarus]|uniref:Uncharacterized protein n=1 Tax=Rhizophagus clarus TaxID=94130 RepID=A0A8H3MI66_9GLOM|nr:hypothetical protein RCL_jg4891.t1 [Rhizophagus clarus]